MAELITIFSSSAVSLYSRFNLRVVQGNQVYM